MKDNLLKSVENEKAILYCMVNSKESCQIAIELLDEFDFTSEYASNLFKAIKKIYISGAYVDKSTIKSYLPADADLYNFYENILQHNSDINAIDAYCMIIRNKTRLRELLNNSKIIQEQILSGEYDVETIIEKAEELIYSVTKIGFTKLFINAIDLVSDYTKKLLIRKKQGVIIDGIITGINELDKLTTGFKRKNMITIAGRPSMGKSELANQIIIENTYKQNIPCILFSLEMSANSIFERLISHILQIDSIKFKTGNISDYELQRYEEIKPKLENMSLYIDEKTGTSINELTSKTRRLKLKNPDLQYIIVDYLGLMESNRKGGNREEEITHISRGLKNLSKMLDITVIILVQLNRQCEMRENKRPIMADLRDSGNIEADSDLIVLLHNDYYYSKNINIHDPQKSEIILAKHREGDIGVINIRNKKSMQTLEDWKD